MIGVSENQSIIKNSLFMMGKEKTGYLKWRGGVWGSVLVLLIFFVFLGEVSLPQLNTSIAGVGMASKWNGPSKLRNK